MAYSTALAWSDERVGRLKALHAMKHSAAVIAADLGVSRSAVLGKIHRLGLAMPSCGTSPELRKQRRRERDIRWNERKRQIRAEAAEGRSRVFVRRPREVKKSTAPKPETDFVTNALHVSLLDLKPGQCRYPYGENPFTFCGCAILPSTSYCEAHYLFCYGGGTASEKSAHRLPPSLEAA